MKVLIIHNHYGRASGEEAVVESHVTLLENSGHEVFRFDRNSTEIYGRWFGEIRAFFSGIYSPSSRRRIQMLLAEHKPDIVHIHNLFPLISPSILPECRKARVHVVMTVHNYRLICPNGLFMIHSQVCEKCRGGREYNCLLNNCESTIFKSLGYGLRNYVARVCRFYRDNVSVFACLTEFQKQKLVEEGFNADRTVVLPNMVDGKDMPPSHTTGDYVAFVGRVSHEKGIANLAKAAALLQNISFRLAGAHDAASLLVRQSPSNVEFVGQLDRSGLATFYDACRLLVLPSIWYEGFPMVLPEAMLRGKPVICSRIGGLPEIVDDGVTGLLFEPGNAEDLAEKIRYLWDRPELCRQMGQAGREKALREYSSEKYYERLMAVYDKAIELGPGGPR